MGPIKLRYFSGERGHATQISERLAIIDNVPFDQDNGNLNYGDIVEFNPDTLTVTGVVHNRFPVHAVIRYNEWDEFHKLVRVFMAVGCVTEGAVGPENDKHGIMVVAAPKGVDPIMIAEGLGIKQRARK